MRVVLLVALSISAQILGQISTDTIPNLADFAGVIARSTAQPPPKSSTTTYASGLMVPQVKPGQAARKLGAQLRNKLEQAAGPNPAFAQLEAAMPKALADIETALEKLGFARRDMGVAVAFAFVTNFETATKQRLAVETSTLAGRNLILALAKAWGPRYATMSDTAKEDTYETLLVGSGLTSALVEQFDKAGKVEEADALRKTAAETFEKLIGVSPQQVRISADGRISGLPESPPPAAAPAPAAASVPASAPVQAPTKIAQNPPLTSLPGVPETYFSKQRPTYTPEELKRMNIDWKIQPMPDEFGCFYRGERKIASEAPDFTLRFLDGSRYEAALQANAPTQGTYVWQKGKYSGGNILWKTGPLKASDESPSWLQFEDHGQTVWIRHLKEGFSCYQRGPGIEFAQLERSKSIVQAGDYSCRAAGDKAPLMTVSFANDGTYRSANGSGTFERWIKASYPWQGEVHFTSGPFRGKEAEYEEDDFGLRELRLDIETGRVAAGGRAMSSESKTGSVCQASGSARPAPVYGVLSAPPPPAGSGGVEGLYLKFGMNNAMGGMNPDSYAYFTKNGYYTEDDPDEAEFDIDCTRTLPNGFPRCQTYKLSGGMLLVDGEKPQPIVFAADSVKIDGSTYNRTYSLEGTRPIGHFRAFSYSPNMMGFQNTGGSSSTVDLYLNADGSFSRERFGSFSYSNISTVPEPTATVSAYSSSQRNTSGQLRFNGFTAEFVFPDGRVERRFAFTIGDPKKDKIDFINIDGRSYFMEKKK